MLYNLIFFLYLIPFICFYKTRYSSLGWYSPATYNCKKSLILITVHISLNSYHCQCANSSIPRNKNPGGMPFVLLFREKQRKVFSVWKCLTKTSGSFCLVLRDFCKINLFSDSFCCSRDLICLKDCEKWDFNF